MDTAWEQRRFDARGGPRKVLFGRMYEDAENIEREAFAQGGRVFCIASAGCTALKLAAGGRHEVVAADINPAQLACAARRIAGEPMVRGTAERVMDFGRRFFPVAGWTRPVVETFLDLDDPEAQRAYWHEHLDTRRFRAGMDTPMSVTGLRAIYASLYSENAETSAPERLRIQAAKQADKYVTGRRDPRRSTASR